MTETKDGPPTATPTLPELARLAVEARPHLDLLRRATPHLTLLLSLEEAMAELPELREALEAVDLAPPAYRIQLRDSLFRSLEARHKAPHGFWEVFLAELDSVTSPPLSTAPAPEQALQPVDRPAPLRKGGPKPTPVTSQTLKDVTRMEEILKGLPLSPELASKRLASLGLMKLAPNRLSNLRTGWVRRRYEAGLDAPGFGPARIPDMLSAIELLAVSMAPEVEIPVSISSAPASPLPPTPRLRDTSPTRTVEMKPVAPISLPDVSESPKTRDEALAIRRARVRVPSAVPTSKREREMLARKLAADGKGVLDASEFARSCQLSLSAGINFLNGWRDAIHLGNKKYRIS